MLSIPKKRPRLLKKHFKASVVTYRTEEEKDEAFVHIHWWEDVIISKQLASNL